jgi:predicted Fe-Mo cluster-binding NifX family protein
VVVAQVGPGAVRRLAERGIQAFMIPDFIDSALRRLIDSGALSKPAPSGPATRRWL